MRFSSDVASILALGAALIVAAALVLPLSAWAASGQGAGQNASQNSGKTRKDLAKVRDRITNLEQQRQKDLKRRQELEAQLRKTETSASRIRQALRNTAEDLAATRTRLDAIRQQIETTQLELAERRDELAGQLRLAHVTGGTERVQALFNQEEPAALERELTWLGYLARSRGELLASIQASLQSLERDQIEATRQEAALAALEAKSREQLAALEDARAERATVIASLDADVKGQARQLARARAEAASLERVLRDLERAAARARQEAAAPKSGKPPAASSPGTGKPLGKGRWPVNGTMLADYGQPRAGGQMRWDGVLIAAPAGSEVRAVRSGKVVYADWLPGLGLLVVLDHGSGYMSLYGHNQDLTRRVGQQIAAGDVVAHVGDTGGQPRPALYYEVRRNGRPFNPHQWGN